MNKTLETPPPGLPVLDLAAISRASRNGATEPANPATLPLPLDAVGVASGEVTPPAGLTVVSTVGQIARALEAQAVMDATGKPPGHRDRLAALGELIGEQSEHPTKPRHVLGALAVRSS